MANTFYRQASFLISAARLDQCPPDEGFEVAFAGRSNAGKSSALNALCDHSGLAKTSRTPGRTQLLNFFTLDDDRRLVDLPGYGYAAVAEGIKREWQGSLAQYLEKRQCLRGLMLMMDIRHPLKDYDRQLLEWAAHIGLPVHALLTKSDKLSRGQAITALTQARKQLTDVKGEVSVQLFSALKKSGLDEAHTKLDQWFQRIA